MSPAPRIIFFGRSISAPPRAVKLFLLTVLPLLLLATLYSFYLVISAFARETGMGYFASVLLLVALSLHVELATKGGKSRTLALLPESGRRLLEAALLVLALYSYWQQGKTFEICFLAFWTAHIAASKLSEYLRSRREALAGPPTA